jgi:hypothetical protein
MVMKRTRAQKVDGVQVIQDSFVGCFWDDGHRDMKRYLGKLHSVEKCRKKALAERWKYFGLQANGECRAANTYGHRKRYAHGKRSASAGCDAQCSKDGNWREERDKSAERQILHGTGWRNAIYRTQPTIWTIKKKTKICSRMAPMLDVTRMTATDNMTVTSMAKKLGKV